jgi:hypothetical protein
VLTVSEFNASQDVILTGALRYNRRVFIVFGIHLEDSARDVVFRIATQEQASAELNS